MEKIVINGQTKVGSGKELAKRLRREGLVPCIMYGGGDPIQFVVPAPEFRHLIFTPEFKLASINIGGKTHNCIVKEIQFHPTTEAVVHLDFLELVPGKNFKAEIPISFEGQAPGVKSGGKFLAKMRSVKVMTTPEALADSISADVSAMEMGSTLRVRDIVAPAGMEIINAPATPIASIEIPRALRSQLKATK